MKIKDLMEAFQVGKFPETPETSKEFRAEYEKLLTNASKIADVRKDYTLYKYNDIFMLAKQDKTIVGMLKLSNAVVSGKDYLEVAGIYVPIQFRKSTALYWLLYAVKETVNKDVIADGAIFDDGQALVDVIQKHHIFYVFDLNKETGEVSEVTRPINSIDHCYLLRTTKLGFGEQIFTEGMEFTWYPLFGEIVE
jgi:hypothetical protein